MTINAEQVISKGTVISGQSRQWHRGIGSCPDFTANPVQRPVQSCRDDDADIYTGHNKPPTANRSAARVILQGNVFVMKCCLL